MTIYSEPKCRRYLRYINKENKKTFKVHQDHFFSLQSMDIGTHNDLSTPDAPDVDFNTPGTLAKGMLTEIV